MNRIKLIYLFIILIFSSSCKTDNSNSIFFFQGQYFQKNQELELNLNDGDFVYKKTFNENYSSGNHKLIKEFKPKTDSISIYLKIDDKDTLIMIPATTKKVLFGNDAYKNLFLYTEKDVDAWIMD